MYECARALVCIIRTELCSVTISRGLLFFMCINESLLILFRKIFTQSRLRVHIFELGGV